MLVILMSYQLTSGLKRYYNKLLQLWELRWTRLLGLTRNSKDGLHNKFLHRIILDCPEGMFIDHINHDKLNNCRSNLRIVTPQQNSMNTSKRKDNKSGVIGVHWHKAGEKWTASIMLNNKHIHLGCFDNLEEASQARKEAEKKYFGEFRNKDDE
jgi:hypothetical protein